MKEQYDFGERKSLKENRIITNDFSNVINRYDFIEEGNVWATIAKQGAQIANTSYAGNALRGAGTGAIIGGVGNMARNMTKRDDDPTKRGMIGSLVSGATSGAGAGAVVGAGARFAARRDIGLAGIKAAGEKALEGAKGTARQDIIRTMNSGAKSFNGHRMIGWADTGANAGKLVRSNNRQIVGIGKYGKTPNFNNNKAVQV